MNDRDASPYTRPVQIGSATVGGGHPFVLLAGLATRGDRLGTGDVFSVADKLSTQTRELDVPLIFRIAARPPERRSAAAFEEMLAVLREIRRRLRVPVAVEVHNPNEVARGAEVADLLQIPAVCCRDIDLLTDAARTGRPVNIEKDPSLAPSDAVRLLEQGANVGNWNVMVTACGTSGDPGIDVRGFTVMRESGFPVVFDAGPNVGGAHSNEPATGELAKHALIAGVDGIAVIVEEETEKTDPASGPVGYSLAALPQLLQRLKAIQRP